MVIQYKCPNCGSDMTYDSTSGKLTCPSCGTQLSMEDYKQSEVKSGSDHPEEAQPGAAAGQASGETDNGLGGTISEEPVPHAHGKPDSTQAGGTGTKGAPQENAAQTSGGTGGTRADEGTAGAETGESGAGGGTEAETGGCFQQGEAVQYQCNNCGAILITNPDTAATTCSFCGAPMILSDRLEGTLAPAKIIPFTISKQQAQDAFCKWCHKGRFTPKGYYSPAKLKAMTGIYVPFWLFDLNARVDLEAEGRRVMTARQGDYIITNTSFYDVTRRADLNYKKIPVDASERMNDTMMDKLEPFFYKDLKDFAAPYLAGYVAEKYNYTDKALMNRVKSRVHTYASQYVRNTISGYNSLTVHREEIDTSEQHADYTFLPVWLLNYDEKNADHIFAMNGQTGKIVGKPPISKPRVAKYAAGIFLGVFAVIKVIAFLIGGVWF